MRERAGVRARASVAALETRPTMEIISRAADMQAWADAARRAGHRIGFVPTMGYLHDGHLSLVHAAGARCERTVASIFVNPLQFGANEDLSRYPRDLAADRARLESAEVDVLYFPDAAE